MNDIKQIDEILNILKTNDFPLWGSPIALDRRDTYFYIQQLMDKYKEEIIKCETCAASEEDIEELKSEIVDLKSDIYGLQSEIKDLEKEIKDLEKEIKDLEEDY